MSRVITARRIAYLRWYDMVRRCTEPTRWDYRYYGGRGITIDPRWLDFDTYYADVGDAPGPGLTIDRRDNDGNYEPGNVRWATYSEQARNRVQHNAAKTHCPQRHEYTRENTVVRNRKRYCRACGSGSGLTRKLRRLAAHNEPASVPA